MDYRGSKGTGTDRLSTYGERMTGSNVGTLGTGVLSQVSSTSFSFRNLHANSNKLSVTLDEENNNILFDIAEGNLNIANIGGFPSQTDKAGYYLTTNGSALSWAQLNTSNIAEGSNQFFTSARVLATAIAGYTSTTASALTGTDTVLMALAKLEAQIATKSSLPSQSGNDGKYLTTDGSTLSWATISGGGVSSTDTINTTSTAHGLSISGSVIRLHAADSTNGGVLTASAQNIGGDKTFINGLIASGGLYVGTSLSTKVLAAAYTGLTGTTDDLRFLSTNTGYFIGYSRVANMTLTANTYFAAVLFGTTAVTTAATGSHSMAAQVAIKPMTITGGGASVANAATLYIEDAPTGSSNNYALWVDGGRSRFDGPISLAGTTTVGNWLIAEYGAFHAVNGDDAQSGFVNGQSHNYIGFLNAGTLASAGSSLTAGTSFRPISATAPTSGTYGGVFTVSIKGPSITTGSGAVTSSAALIVSAGSGATSNYALWVKSGEANFSGAVTMGGLSNSASSQILYYNGGVISYGAVPGIPDGDKGDINVSSSGTVWTIESNSITFVKFQQISSATFLGRVSASTGSVEALTSAQATTLIDVFTTSLKGLAPASGGGTANFLRADGTWAAPPAVADGDKGDIVVSASGATWTIDSGAVTLGKLQDIATATFLGRNSPSTGGVEVITATQATALLNTFTTSLKGLAPASGGGTANFLRADGTWAVPGGSGSGTVSSGSANHVAYYTANGTTVGGSVGLRYNGTTLTVTSATGSGSHLEIVYDATRYASFQLNQFGGLDVNMYNSSSGAGYLRIDGGFAAGNTISNFYISSPYSVTNSVLAPTFSLGAVGTSFNVGLGGGDTSSAVDANKNYGTVIIATATVATNVTGTHDLFAALIVKPVEPSIATTLNNTATVYIHSAASTVAPNNYALWVQSGQVRLGDVAGTGTRFVAADSNGVLAAQTAAQATALLSTFSSTLKGLAPASGGGTANFLRADGTWAAPGGISWTEVTGTSQTVSGGNGYIMNNASQITITLPATASVGSQIVIAGKGAGGWKIAVSPTKVVYFGNQVAADGSFVSSTHYRDAVTLLCTSIDSAWTVISSVGNINFS